VCSLLCLCHTHTLTALFVHSYIVHYQYRVRGSERHRLYFWLGRDSSITERGAAAVATIAISDDLGGAVPQHRVLQGKEPRHFLRLFLGGIAAAGDESASPSGPVGGGGMVVHLGKQAGPPPDTEVRLYQLRRAEHGEYRCIEAESPGTCAGSGPYARTSVCVCVCAWSVCMLVCVRLRTCVHMFTPLCLRVCLCCGWRGPGYV
jgi:hypothetical protein